MIVSASYRTDIPAFYGRWFQQRLLAEEAWVKNPYSSKPYRVSLAPSDVAGFVFWTRNLAPFAEALAAIEAMHRPYVVQYTITGYPAALEVGVPPAAHGIAQLRALAGRRGGDVGVWRYDPILISSLTPPAWHRETFARIAAQLAGSVDEVTVSFCSPYRKTTRNLNAAATRHSFTWHDQPLEEKQALLGDLASIAADQGMRLTACTQPDLPSPSVEAAACIDAVRLSRIAGHAVAAKQKGNRPGCLCAESRDIGAYDTCAHGCTYCYAVSDHERAKAAVKSSDPAQPMLR